MRRRILWLAPAAMTFTVAYATWAAAAVPGVYTGKVPRRHDRNMDIWLQVLAGGRAKWRVDVAGPCSSPHIAFGWSIGIGTGPGFRLLRIRAGHFAISKRGTITKRDPRVNGQDAYRYSLAGHVVHGGFAGTFHWSERSTLVHPAVTCDSGVMHWRVHRTARLFP